MRERGGEDGVQYFGVKETDLPAIVLQDQTQEKKFIREGIQPSDIPKFFEDLKVALFRCQGEDAAVVGSELSKIQRFKDGGKWVGEVMLGCWGSE